MFTLVILLVSLSTQDTEEFLVSGYENKMACQDHKAWMYEHPYMKDGEVYKIVTADCVRARNV